MLKHLRPLPFPVPLLAPVPRFLLDTTAIGTRL